MIKKLSFDIPRDSKGRVNPKRLTPKMINEIFEVTSWVNNLTAASLNERTFCIKHNITEYAKCSVCSNDVKWLPSISKYSLFCSKACALKSKERKDKTIATNILKYGTEHPSKLESNRLLAKQTNFELYGDINHNNHEKFKQTCLEKYGFEFAQQSQVVKDKMSITSANNFQVRRNTEGTDYKGVVYILHFPEHNAVKIGLTNNFEQRSTKLIKDFGGFTILQLIETDRCYQLEKELHEKFSDFRICLNEGTGRTEFFNEEILTTITI